MDRLKAMEVALAVGEAGGFAAAATRLKMSPPAVTRMVAALEDELGIRLFNRTTRRVGATEAGARYLEAARRVLAELDAVERAAHGEAATPSGRLQISTSVTFGRAYVTELVADFLRTELKVTASLLMTDRVVDLVEEGIDVAIRIGDLPDSTLMARQVGKVRRVLVASPGYLAARDEPQDPEDLKAHDVIAFTGLMPGREWRFVARDGRAGSVAVSPRLELNDAAAALAAAARGEGITVALSYMLEQQLSDGRLRLVLEPFCPPPVPVQIVHARGRLLAPKIRAFVDFAVPWLKARLGST